MPEGQTEIAPEAPTESVSPDEGVTEEIPENAPSEEYPLEEQPVEDDSVLIEESEETEEPTESAEEQPSDEVTEDTLPDELSAEEVMPEDDGVEAELEESTTDEILEYEHPVKTAALVQRICLSYDRARCSSVRKFRYAGSDFHHLSQRHFAGDSIH